MKIMLTLMAMFLVLLAGAAGWSFHTYTTPSVKTDSIVLIAPGTGGRAILKQLHREGVIPSPITFALPVALAGEYRHFKAGEYQFVAGLTPAQVLASIARGEVIIHAVTVPEGFSVAQVRALLHAEELLVGDVPAMVAEGSLYPDTVHYQRGDTRASIITRLQAQQRKTLNDAWMQRAEGLPLATPDEVLTLASIVEEETGVPAERGRVAAVYINRLRMGMPLQADPTVAYGIAPEGLKRALTRADLKRDTPYNTYTRSGLPPGPICNPGKASILAVLNPPSTKEIFFVATGNGGHNFAATLAEHNANIARYRSAKRANAAR